jgi:DNA-binding MarR family transcriptional regulator
MNSPINTSVQPASSSQVLRRFRLVFNTVKTHFQQVEKKAGVGGAQLWALSVIHAQPGIGVNDLAKSMDVHQTTASNLVKSLVNMAMVQVAKEGPDRRAVQLYLMPAGQRVLVNAPGPFTGVLPQALSQLDEETLSRLHHDLGLLLDQLKIDEGAAQTPLAHM